VNELSTPYFPTNCELPKILGVDHGIFLIKKIVAKKTTESFPGGFWLIDYSLIGTVSGQTCRIIHCPRLSIARQRGDTNKSTFVLNSKL